MTEALEVEAFDVIVVGNGAAGDGMARTLARQGKSVAVIERRYLGGECLNDGCIPSKALIELVNEGGHLPWNEIVARIRGAQLLIRGSDPDGGMQEAGIELVWGDAHFTGPRTIRVGERELTATHVAITTGTDPGIPPVPGLAEARPQTNQTVFEMAERPASLAVIGGGPIGLELGQAFHRLGTAVTIFESADRIAGTEDAEVSLEMQRIFGAAGIRVDTGVTLEQVERLPSGQVRITTRGGQSVFDEVLVAAGRRARVPDGLVDLGLELDARGFVVIDGCGHTNLPGLWAAGDVTGRFQFTHYASYQGGHVTDHIGNDRCEPIPDTTVPWAIFTSPEVGHVGPTEAQAREQYERIAVSMLRADRIDWFRTRGRTDGFAKVIADASTGKLIAAHLICDRASSIIGEATLAVSMGLRPADVANTIHPYPASNDIFRWVCSKLGRQLALRFTPEDPPHKQ